MPSARSRSGRTPVLPVTPLQACAALIFIWVLLCGACATGGGGAGPVLPGAVPSSSGTHDVLLWTLPQGSPLPLAPALADAAPALRVATVAAAGGEAAAGRLAAGGRPDLIETCTNEGVARLARAGLLQPIDTARIQQWARLYPALKELPGVVVDGRVYMVPLVADVTGIIYNPVRTPAPPRSFRDLFAPRNAGRLGFADDSALATAVAALDLGFADPSRLTADQVDAVAIYLKRYRKQFRSFWLDPANLAVAFKDGHVRVATGDYATFLDLRRRGAPVAFVLAREGQPLRACGLVIPKRAGNPDAAYALINALLLPAAQARLAAGAGRQAANRDARAASAVSTAADRGIDLLARLQKPVPLLSELDHPEWLQTWYEVKMRRG